MLESNVLVGYLACSLGHKFVQLKSHTEFCHDLASRSIFQEQLQSCSTKVQA